MVLIVHCGTSINTADYYSTVMVDFYLFFFPDCLIRPSILHQTLAGLLVKSVRSLFLVIVAGGAL